MRRLPFVAATLVAIGLTACGGVEPTTNPTSTQEPTAPASQTPTSEPTDPATEPSTPASLPEVPAGQDGAVAYFLYAPAEAENPYLASVWMPAARDLSDALTALLDGPDPAHGALSTSIPAGTALNEVTMDGTTAVVDLDGAFASGGGSASMFARLAQVTYTATQFDDITDVRLLLDGDEVETFSNEGIELDQPIEPSDWYDVGVLPKLFVQRPALGETVGSAFTMTGLAQNLFEATFTYEVSDGADEVFAEGPVTAEGSEGWNAFTQDVTYTPAEAMSVTLTVTEYSARDGSVVFTSSYPITIDPAR